jgi:hypothetical protein
MREACTFAVAVAVDRARYAKEARRDFVKHLTPGEINAYFRICANELNLDTSNKYAEHEDNQ